MQETEAINSSSASLLITSTRDKKGEKHISDVEGMKLTGAILDKLGESERSALCEGQTFEEMKQRMSDLLWDENQIASVSILDDVEIK